MANHKVFSNSSLGSPAIWFPSSPLMSSSLCAALLSTQKCVSDLLLEFPDVLSSDGFPASPPRHPVCHHLLTRPGLPIFAKSHRLDPEKLAVAKAEFSGMEKSGIIRFSTSPWASPLHMVKKKEGSWRPWGDYGGWIPLLFLTVILSPITPILPWESTDLQCSPSWTYSYCGPCSLYRQLRSRFMYSLRSAVSYSYPFYYIYLFVNKVTVLNMSFIH